MKQKRLRNTALENETLLFTIYSISAIIDHVTSNLQIIDE